MKTEFQAMLLAAGLGTRLWPLTADRAKPAVPFLGRPLIAGIVELLAKHGFGRCVVNTHHRAESVREALIDAPIEVAFSHEETILGTAGCLAKAMQDGLLDPDRPTVIINAKLFTDIDLSAVIRAHESSGARVTMVLKPNVDREEFREVLVEDDRVIGFGETKIPAGPSPLLFTGIHALEPEVLRSTRAVFSDTITDVYPPLIAAKRVHAFVDRAGRWWEFSTLARYLELHARAAEEGLGPRVVCSKGAIVEEGAVIDRAVVWENARIEAGAVVRDAIVGRGVSIRGDERVERCAIVQIEGERLAVSIPP